METTIIHGVIQGLEFRDITLRIMENQMEKNMDNEMETLGPSKG